MTRAYNGFFEPAKRLQRSFPAVFPRLQAKESSVINASRRRGYEGALRLPPAGNPVRSAW